MGGIKHHLQAYGLQPGDNQFNKIEDPIARDFAFKSINVSVYCKKCGQPILMPAREERRDYELEMRAQMHEQCLRDVEADMRAEQIAKQKAEQERRKAFDLEAYAANFFKDRE